MPTVYLQDRRCKHWDECPMYDCHHYDPHAACVDCRVQGCDWKHERPECVPLAEAPKVRKADQPKQCDEHGEYDRRCPVCPDCIRAARKMIDDIPMGPSDRTCPEHGPHPEGLEICPHCVVNISKLPPASSAYEREHSEGRCVLHDRPFPCEYCTKEAFESLAEQDSKPALADDERVRLVRQVQELTGDNTLLKKQVAAKDRQLEALRAARDEALVRCDRKNDLIASLRRQIVAASNAVDHILTWMNHARECCEGAVKNIGKMGEDG